MAPNITGRISYVGNVSSDLILILDWVGHYITFEGDKNVCLNHGIGYKTACLRWMNFIDVNYTSIH